MASLFDRLKMIPYRLIFSYVHIMPLEMALTFLKDNTYPNLPETSEKCKKHLARFHLATYSSHCMAITML